MSIEQFELEDILATIRKFFTEVGDLEADEAYKQVGYALGFQRVSAKTREGIRSTMNAAVRRGIVASDRGMYSIDCKRITDYPDELIEKYFYAVIGRAWWERDEAIKATARYLGFRRTGSAIVEAFEKVIRRGVRRKELERDGEWVRRMRE